MAWASLRPARGRVTTGIGKSQRLSTEYGVLAGALLNPVRWSRSQSVTACPPALRSLTESHDARGERHSTGLESNPGNASARCFWRPTGIPVSQQERASTISRRLRQAERGRTGNPPSKKRTGHARRRILLCQQPVVYGKLGTSTQVLAAPRQPRLFLAWAGPKTPYLPPRPRPTPSRSRYPRFPTKPVSWACRQTCLDQLGWARQRNLLLSC